MRRKFAICWIKATESREYFVRRSHDRQKCSLFLVVPLRQFSSLHAEQFLKTASLGACLVFNLQQTTEQSSRQWTYWIPTHCHGKLQQVQPSTVHYRYRYRSCLAQLALLCFASVMKVTGGTVCRVPVKSEAKQNPTQFIYFLHPLNQL